MFLRAPHREAMNDGSLAGLCLKPLSKAAPAEKKDVIRSCASPPKLNFEMVQVINYHLLGTIWEFPKPKPPTIDPNSPTY